MIKQNTNHFKRKIFNVCYHKFSTKQWHKNPIHALIVLIFYSLLYILFFSPVILGGRLLAPGDGTIYYLPNFYSIKTLWEPLLLSGFPVASDIQAMTWYPLALIFSLFRSWNGFVISAYVLASSFVYGYVYTLTQSRLAGMVSGIIYGMSGFMMVHLGHTSIIHAAVWMPLFIWTIEKLHDHFTPQWFTVACVAVACSALSGHPQILVYTLGIGGAYTLVRGWSRGDKSFWYYGSYGIIVVFGLALAAIQLIPFAELTRLGLRVQMSFTDFLSYTLPSYQIVEILFPYLFGGIRESFYGIPYFGKWNAAELTGYIGLLPLMLAVIGFVAHGKKSLAWVWFGIGLFAFLLTLTLFSKFMYYLPIYNKFRCHARNFIVMGLAVSVLSGLGIEAIQKRMVSREMILRTIIMGVAIMFAGFITIFLSSTRFQAMATEKGVGSIKLLPWSNPSVGIPLIIFLLAIISLIFWDRQSLSRFRQLFLISVLVIDLGSFGWFVEWKYHSPNKNLLTPPISTDRYIKLLQENHQRLLPIRGGRGGVSEFLPNISRLWGVPSASGYGPLILSRVSEVVSMNPGGMVSGLWAFEFDRSLDMMAIRYIFLPQHDTEPASHFESNGFFWVTNDLPIQMGAGCNVLHSDSFKLYLAAPFRATTVGVVSALACSTEIPNNTEVVRIKITDIYGNSQIRSMHAGKDTSEWAYDCSDVRPTMKHQRAPIFKSFPVVRNSFQPCEGHNYLTVFHLGEKVEIKNLELQWVGPSAIIGIQKISLLDQKTEQSYPLSGVISALANPERWRHIENIGDISIYENLRAMPRLWLVPEVVNLNPEEVLHVIKKSIMPNGKIFEPSQIALVEEPLSFKAKYFDKMATAQIVHFSNTRIEIHTKSASPSFLVLSDVYYPGWKATVDGDPTHIFQTNYVLRGVMVPQGEHIIKFEFKSKRFYLGLYISLAAVFMLACIFAFSVILRNY